MHAQDSMTRGKAARAGLREMPLPPRHRVPWWACGSIVFPLNAALHYAAAPPLWWLLGNAIGFGLYWALAMLLEGLHARKMKRTGTSLLVIPGGGGGPDLAGRVSLIEERLDGYEAAWEAMAVASPAVREAHEAWASSSPRCEVFRLPGSDAV